MALLTLRDVEKHFGDRHLLTGVSLVVGEEDRIGLVGANGAGKTTLLRILAGLEEFDDGERTVRRGLRIAYLEQEPRLDDAATVRDAVARTGCEPHQVAAMIDRVGLPDPEARCGTLSGGERRRAALAGALLGEPDLLLLDEPTNHLDAFVTDWLERFLDELATPLVMVTHDRYFLDRVAARIVEIDRGTLVSYADGYAGFLRARSTRLSAERRAESSRLNLLRRESEWMRRGPQGRGTKAKARVRRFEDLAAARPANVPDDLALTIPDGPRLGKKVLELKGVTKAFGDRVILAGLDLLLGPGDRLGIVGPNGAGKTTMLRVCMGLLEPDAGKVEIGSTVKFAYIDQDRADLDPKRSVLKEIAGDNNSVCVGGKMTRIEGFLERFLFKRSEFKTPVGELSGGERNRVLLAKLLIEGGNVLVLDEPTNDLDLMTLRALEEALVAFEGAVIVVSHDRFFLDRVATQIVHLDGGGKSRLHPGDMTSLLDALRRAPKPSAKKPKRPRERRPSTPRLGYREQREIEAIPDRIAALEKEAKALDTELADPALYAKAGSYVKEVTARRKEIETEVNALYARWEELESR